MLTKLIIQRYGEEDDFQTLHINILEDDNDKTSEIIIGEWHVAVDDTVKKEKDKCRLIVKVETNENSSILDLDTCAKKLEKCDNFLTKSPNDKSQKQFLLRTYDTLYKTQSNSMLTELVKNKDLDQEINIDNNDACFIKNPLEYSLQKVKENNAKIMENIHMLNRTLNYTKKNEIIDLYNPRTFRSYPCEDCGKCFVYETGLRRHYIVRHSNLDMQQRWQLVWTCTECFQVWPRKELAINHANQCCNNYNIDSIQEIKASSVLQCEFCEKVFTNIPRLLRHLKGHTVLRNYECNPCDMTFSCYKTAEQHWLSCQWLKMYYQFSLPKLLLCNACDRKFRNYDQLYIHRYKAEHFIPKITKNDGNMTLGTLAYQCEICGWWFNSIIQIHEHRNYYHPHYNNGLLHITDHIPEI